MGWAELRPNSSYRCYLYSSDRSFETCHWDSNCFGKLLACFRTSWWSLLPACLTVPTLPLSHNDHWEKTPQFYHKSVGSERRTYHNDLGPKSFSYSSSNRNSAEFASTYLTFLSLSCWSLTPLSQFSSSLIRGFFSFSIGTSPDPSETYWWITLNDCANSETHFYSSSNSAWREAPCSLFGVLAASPSPSSSSSPNHIFIAFAKRHWSSDGSLMNWENTHCRGLPWCLRSGVWALFSASTSSCSYSSGSSNRVEWVCHSSYWIWHLCSPAMASHCWFVDSHDPLACSSLPDTPQIQFSTKWAAHSSNPGFSAFAGLLLLDPFALFQCLRSSSKSHPNSSFRFLVIYLHFSASFLLSFASIIFSNLSNFLESSLDCPISPTTNFVASCCP